MRSKADKVLEEVAKACQNPLLVAIGAMSLSPQQAVNLAESLDLTKEEIQQARWLAVLKRDCQTFFGQDFLTVFREICTKKEQTPMRNKEAIWTTITGLINSLNGDSFDFFKKFQAEYRNKRDFELQAVLAQLEQETMQVFVLYLDYRLPCSCHPTQPRDHQCKFGWNDTAKIAYYEHNNLYRALLIAELLSNQSAMEQFYHKYLQQLQITETWIKDNDSHILHLYDFIYDIDNRLLLSEIAKIAVEIHPQHVYFPCKDGRIDNPIFFTYVKKRLLEIEGVNQARFCANNLDEDPEFLAIIAEYEANPPPPKKMVVTGWGNDSMGRWQPQFKEV